MTPIIWTLAGTGVMALKGHSSALLVNFGMFTRALFVYHKNFPVRIIYLERD